MAAVVEHPTTENQAYNIAGAEPLTFNEVIDTVSKVLKRRVTKLHLPAGPVVSCLAALERTGLRLPITSEQILRLNEDKAFDYSKAAQDFGFESISFQEGIEREIKQMELSR